MHSSSGDTTFTIIVAKTKAPTKKTDRIANLHDVDYFGDEHCLLHKKTTMTMKNVVQYSQHVLSTADAVYIQYLGQL